MNGYEEARILMQSAERPMVFSGAGMSSESGMATFRGEQGLWNDRSAEALSSIEGFLADPAAAWDWYARRFHARDSVRPHAGYLALVRLQENVGRLPVVTQNVDGLHQAAGLSEVYELHGSMRTASCSRSCGFSSAVLDDRLLDMRPPLCPGCGAPLRPDVVLFGEPLPAPPLREAHALVGGWADTLLVVGTSMVVWPAAAIPWEALKAGIEVIELNPEPTPLSRTPGVIWIPGRAAEVLPGLVEP